MVSVYCAWHRLNTNKRVYVLPAIGIVLVLYCVTNYYQLSSQKQYLLLNAQFCWSEVQHALAGFSAQNLRLKSRSQLGCVHFWRCRGRISFPPHSGRWPNSVACRVPCKAKVPLFLAASHGSCLMSTFPPTWPPPAMETLLHVKILFCFKSPGLHF